MSTGRLETRNTGSFARALITNNPTSDEQAVAKRVVPMIAVGFRAPAAVRTAIAEMGTN
jgi:hypothetical protein